MMELTKTIPKAPGIYLFKGKYNNIIYVGKAKSLHNRVRSYFQKSHKDWKVSSLLAEHKTIEYILTKNEEEALLLEAQLIRDHRPKYNVLLKDGQPYVYILFTNDPLSKIKLVRNKKQKGKYFGPFLQKIQARKTVRFLERTFKLILCNKTIENGCLDYHIGICAGNCKSDFDREDYLFRLQLAIDALKKNHKGFLKNLKTKIAEYSNILEFEKAKHLNEYVQNIDSIFHTLEIKYSPKKFENDVFAATTPIQEMPDRDLIAQQLQKFLQLDRPVKSIDCFDISHFQSSHIVGSCVRFTYGTQDKNNFRRFRIKTLDQQNDYAALQEIVSRRYKDPDTHLPDVIMIDGGKGQLSAALVCAPDIPVISLAKQEERIFSNAFLDGKVLDVKTDVGKLLIALRDYTHHFAISYHKKRRHKDLQKQPRSF